MLWCIESEKFGVPRETQEEETQEEEKFEEEYERIVKIDKLLANETKIIKATKKHIKNKKSRVCKMRCYQKNHRYIDYHSTSSSEVHHIQTIRAV